jgi:hypothetical protein
MLALNFYDFFGGKVWGRDIFGKFHCITESNGYCKGLLLYVFDQLFNNFYDYTETISLT